MSFLCISCADLTLGAHKSHQCKSGNPCTCVMPKKRTKKKGAAGDHQLNTQASHELLGPTRTSSQILARIAELRPVLPRPSHDDFNQGGPVHLPSVGMSHGHASRHPEHVFKPYERAYGMTHQHPVHPQSYAATGPSNPTFTFNNQPFTGQMMGAPPNNPWTPRQENIGLDNPVFPSLCGCGDDCRCPGCVYHNPSTNIPSSAYSSCSNPGACGTCLDCTILSLPPSALPPPDTALSIYDSQPDAIDEWLRQMSSSIPTTSQSFQNFSPSGAQFQQPTQSWGGSRSFPYDQQSNLDRNPRIQPPFDNYCRSPPPSMGFMTSGERGPDYPQRVHRTQSSMSSMDGRSVIDPRLLPPNGVPSYFDPYRSRSPSASSQSSHQSSQDNQCSGPVPVYRPSERVQGIFSNVNRTSPPRLNLRPVINRGPSSASSGASPASGPSSSTRPSYGGNSGDGSCDPSLANLHIY